MHKQNQVSKLFVLFAFTAILLGGGYFANCHSLSHGHESSHTDSISSGVSTVDSDHRHITAYEKSCHHLESVNLNTDASLIISSSAQGKFDGQSFVLLSFNRQTSEQRLAIKASLPSPILNKHQNVLDRLNRRIRV